MGDRGVANTAEEIGFCSGLVAGLGDLDIDDLEWYTGDLDNDLFFEGGECKPRPPFRGRESSGEGEETE